MKRINTLEILRVGDLEFLKESLTYKAIQLKKDLLKTKAVVHEFCENSTQTDVLTTCTFKLQLHKLVPQIM